MNKLELKLGMWRTRDGRIVCVPYIEPEWMVSAEGIRRTCVIFVDTKEKLQQRWAGSERHFTTYGPYGYFGDRLAEHLSDDIADPRTWTPPVTLKEGLWEMSDGSVQLVCIVDKSNTRVWWVCNGRNMGAYNSNGTPYHAYRPNAVRYLGPSPLRGPTQE